MTYFGKIFIVGTWHFMWKTLGQRSQHNRSPPLIQTAHQSSLGSSSFPAQFSFPPSLASVPFCKFPLVRVSAMLLLSSEHVVTVAKELAASEQFVLGHRASDGGSVLMLSPKVLTLWPGDTSPTTGRGLFSGLLI